MYPYPPRLPYIGDWWPLPYIGDFPPTPWWMYPPNHVTYTTNTTRIDTNGAKP